MRSLIFGILFCVGLAGIVFVSSILVLRPEIVESSQAGPISPFLEGQKIVESQIQAPENLVKEKNVVHFLVMYNLPGTDNGFNRTGTGTFRIHEDGNGDGLYSEGLDPMVKGSKTTLPDDYIFPYGWTGHNGGVSPFHLGWVGCDLSGALFFSHDQKSPVEIKIARKGIDGQSAYQLRNPELKMWLWSHMN
jgi:hypothetical protein